MFVSGYKSENKKKKNRWESVIQLSNTVLVDVFVDGLADTGEYLNDSQNFDYCADEVQLKDFR